MPTVRLVPTGKTLAKVALNVLSLAEVGERELHEQHRHHEGEAIHEIMKQLDEIRREMGCLSNAVNELRERR